MIGIVAHTEKPGAETLLASIIAELTARNSQVLLEDSTSRLVGPPSGLSMPDLGRQSRILVVLGGDGTLLKAVGDLEGAIVPIFGINTGSLGFLTCVGAAAYREAVAAICENRFTLSRRTLLDVTVERDGRQIAHRTGLNDAVLSRGNLSRLIKLETWVNGTILTEFNADGLIVSTATGSTAYSLAAGGPIMSPDSGVFAITPICPHVLTNRAVIVSDASVIQIRPCRSGPEVFLTVDGQRLHALAQDDLVRVTRASHVLPLATLPDTTFFEVLRQKLKWSGSTV